MINLRTTGWGRCLLLLNIIPGLTIYDEWYTQEEIDDMVVRIRRSYESDKDYWERHSGNYYRGIECPRCGEREIEQDYYVKATGSGDFNLGFGYVNVRSKSEKYYKCKKCGRAWEKDDFDDNSLHKMCDELHKIPAKCISFADDKYDANKKYKFDLFDAFIFFACVLFPITFLIGTQIWFHFIRKGM